MRSSYAAFRQQPSQRYAHKLIPYGSKSTNTPSLSFFAVSGNWGSVLWAPLQEEPYYLGFILGPLILGNSHLKPQELPTTTKRRDRRLPFVGGAIGRQTCRQLGEGVPKPSAASWSWGSKEVRSKQEPASPNYALRFLQILPNRGHKALNRGTWGVLEIQDVRRVA